MAPTQHGGGQVSSKRQLALSWREDEIISVFEQTPEIKANGYAVTGFDFPPKDPVAYVKFRYPPERMAEVKNHDYVFRALKARPSDERHSYPQDLPHVRKWREILSCYGIHTRKDTCTITGAAGLGIPEGDNHR